MELSARSRDLATRKRADPIGDLVGAFESETAAVLLETRPVNEHIILYAIVAMVLLTIVACCFVRLDRVVTSVGGVITTTRGLLYISPLDSGVIKEVRVKAGQTVKKGDALAILDPTFTEADLQQIQSHLASDMAQIDREEAELNGSTYTSSNADQYHAIQGGIWQKRQAQYHSDLANFDGQIHGAEAQLAQSTADADKYASRLKLASQAEDVYAPLLEKGYVSKLQVMQASDTKTEMSRLLADAMNEISQHRELVTSMKAQRESYIQKWHSDVANQLISDRNDLDTTQKNLEKARKLRDLTALDAPEDAIVLKVGKISPGSVAAGGGQDAVSSTQDPLFTLVPLDAPVEADIKISANDIGFIETGDKVNLKLDAYPFIRHGTVEGVVRTISEGSFTLDENNVPVSPYFKARVAITRSRLKNIPQDFRLVPGMTLTGEIIVGRRTIMSYLLEGALRTGSEAMREPQ